MIAGVAPRVVAAEVDALLEVAVDAEWVQFDAAPTVAAFVNAVAAAGVA